MTDGVEDDAWTTEEQDEEEHSEALSCIGVRRLCLKDIACRRLLHEFRRFCVENTNIHQCITTQWLVV